MIRRLLLVASCALAAGCMTLPAARQLDERFNAGWRPSAGHCAWGGETELLAAYCARVNFGADGALAIVMAVNRDALDGAAPGAMPWAQHIERARAALEPYAQDYRVQELEWCGASRSDCHRSLLVTDNVTDARFVLDNGEVIAGSPHVATYDEFVSMVARCGGPPC